MQTALNLLDQIIEVAKAQDEEWKKIHQKMHKSSQTIGEGFVIYHLRILKELLLKEEQQQKFPLIIGETISHDTGVEDFKV